MRTSTVLTLFALILAFTGLREAAADPHGAYHTYNGITYYVTQLSPHSREIALGMRRSKYLSLSQNERDKLKASLVKNYVGATKWHGQVLLNIGDENENDLDFLEVDNP